MSLLSAQQAAELLDVKLPTLYAYVSRGLLSSIADPQDARRRLYRKADVMRLKARADVTSGHAPAAAAALRWGEPVMETAISDITYCGPRYRGRAAVDLADDGWSLQRVASWLWTGGDDNEPTWRWDVTGAAASLDRATLNPTAQPLEKLINIVLAQRNSDDDLGRRLDEIERAERTIAGCILGLDAPAHTRDDTSAASKLLGALGGQQRADDIDLMRRALILIADHELNASTFAVRTTASTGADLYACLLTGLAALSGPLHGGGPTIVMELFDEIAQGGSAVDWLHKRMAASEPLMGFAHPLYPGGDPRAKYLLEVLERHSAYDDVIARAVDASSRLDLGPPSADFALAAVERALNLVAGAGTAIFAVGRMTGWVAHALEQREQAFVIRPRAKFRTDES